MSELNKPIRHMTYIRIKSNELKMNIHFDQTPIQLLTAITHPRDGPKRANYPYEIKKDSTIQNNTTVEPRY